MQERISYYVGADSGRGSRTACGSGLRPRTPPNRVALVAGPYKVLALLKLQPRKPNTGNPPLPLLPTVVVVIVSPAPQ